MGRPEEIPEGWADFEYYAEGSGVRAEKCQRVSSQA